MRLGYNSEASAFVHWIEARCGELKPGPPLQPMYRVAGGHDLEEIRLRHFRGYRQSRPVRIGHGAAEQLQLDIYGELTESTHILNKLVQPTPDDFRVT